MALALAAVEVKGCLVEGNKWKEWQPWEMKQQIMGMQNNTDNRLLQAVVH